MCRSPKSSRRLKIPPSGFRYPGLYRHLELDCFRLAARPADWRPDYSPRPSACGLSRRLTRIRAAIDSKPFSSRGNYTLNPFLLYTGSDTYPISYDLRQEPEVIDIAFPNLGRPSNSLDFCQLATTPPVDELCLWHPRLPWYVHIQASHSNGVTIQDVLCQLHDQLMEGICASHFWNTELSARDREEIDCAFAHRCEGNQQRWERGVVKMDFLRFDCVFLGLAKSKDGMWEIKTQAAIP